MIYFIIYVTPKISLTSAFCLQKAHLKLIISIGAVISRPNRSHINLSSPFFYSVVKVHPPECFIPASHAYMKDLWGHGCLYLDSSVNNPLAICIHRKAVGHPNKIMKSKKL